MLENHSLLTVNEIGKIVCGHQGNSSHVVSNILIQKVDAFGLPYIKKPFCSAVYSDKNPSPSSGMKGFYRRPSRAIEKGGGFYIPGLEDEKLRLVAVAGLMVMFAINRSGSPVQSPQLILSEMTGVSMAVLLFIQSLFIVFPESTDNQSTKFLSILQSSGGNSSRQITENIIRSLARTCEGINYILVLDGEDGIIEFGPVGGRIAPSTFIKEIERLVLEKNITTDAFIGKISNLIPVGIIPSTEGVEFIVVRKDVLGRIWLIGGEKLEDIERSKSWASNLMDVPYK
eukprot:gene5718-11543_t